MGKHFPDVLLRVWTPQGGVKFVREIWPAVTDLTGRGAQSGPQVGDYPTGAWAPAESRDYHIGVQVTAKELSLPEFRLADGVGILLDRGHWPDRAAVAGLSVTGGRDR
jgi:hypothetical protein